MFRWWRLPGELGLAEEALLDLLLVALAGLDRDVPLDERIPALVDGAEAADTDLLDDLVLADLRQHERKKIVPRGYHSERAPRRDRRPARSSPRESQAAAALTRRPRRRSRPPSRARPRSRDVYRPPADGQVTAPQVEMYLGVLDRVRLDRKAGKADAAVDPLAAVPADVAAARVRGLNTEEFLWVKERVLEAEAAAMTARLNASVLAMLDKTLADLKARRADAADEGSRKLIAEQIANFEAEADRVRRESREKEPDSVRANIRTLEPFRARLGAAHEALDRPLAPAGGKDAPRTASPKP